MYKLTPRLMTALATFIIGIVVTAVWVVSHPSKPKVMPVGAWESIFFRTINARTSAANLPSLRDVPVSGEDLEVRFWVGFGTNGEDAYILRRKSHQWSGVHIQGIHNGYLPEKYQDVKPLAAPKSGWESMWQRLVEAGILTLPDATAIGCNNLGLDGVGYIAEINVNGIYRAYKYSNPQFAQCAEAKHVIEVSEILYDEFGIWQEP